MLFFIRKQCKVELRNVEKNAERNNVDVVYWNKKKTLFY
jgi:hypothetical protein